MKNLKTEIHGEAGEFMDYAGLVRAVVSASAMREGVTIGEMRKQLAILDKCEDAGDELTLTDSETTILKDLLKRHKWPILHKDLVGFAAAFGDED